jgi:DNA (cytosine-5)-methyltransferase 1
MSNVEITAATLFSGIGAPETAMPHWRWPWHAEIEKFPSAVLAQRHPESVNIGDVTGHEFTERASAVAKPSVLVFGSPCQSFSVAGKRLGLDDPRGNLALCALGIIARLEPRWFVFENVPGLLSSSEGRDFGLFLRAVDELGYSLAWAVLDAQHFGVAQRRERVFAVGHLGDWRGPAAVLFEPEGLCGNYSPREQARQEIASGLGAGSKRSGGRIGRREAAGNQLIAGTLGEPCHPLAAAAHPPAVAYGIGSDAIDRTGEGAAGNAAERSGLNIVENCQPSLRARPNNSVATASAVRRLTPRECERLQGYPDDYTAITFRGKPAADGPRYKALGNSMAIPVMRWILTRIETLEVNHGRKSANPG